MRLKNASIAVLGAARSGIALANLLASHVTKVFLSEQRPQTEVSVPVEELQQKGIELEFDGHSKKVLEADLICISPGIPLTVPILQEAQQSKIPVLGEIEVSSWFCEAPFVAITGSNGKTTTTTLCGDIFKRHYSSVLVGGNIGAPLADQLRLKLSKKTDVAILELSSFQLETIVNFHPSIAVIMNLSPNHLDRYPGFEAYAEAKMRILNNMNELDLLIYNADDPLLCQRIEEVKPQKIPFSIQQTNFETGAYWKDNNIYIHWKNMDSCIPMPHPHLRGPHNRYNMLVAALIAAIWNIPIKTIRETIENFPGIEHRLENSGIIDGVKYVNDSKATSVDSLRWALQSFDEKIVLIAGGKDKGGEYSEVDKLLKEKVRAVMVIGQAALRMKEAWSGVVPVYSANDLDEAVKKSSALAQADDVVLLSPACSSFDMFRDYEQRGNRFKEIVRQISVTQDTHLVE